MNDFENLCRRLEKDNLNAVAAFYRENANRIDLSRLKAFVDKRDMMLDGYKFKNYYVRRMNALAGKWDLALDSAKVVRCTIADDGTFYVHKALEYFNSHGESGKFTEEYLVEALGRLAAKEELDFYGRTVYFHPAFNDSPGILIKVLEKADYAYLDVKDLLGRNVAEFYIDNGCNVALNAITATPKGSAIIGDYIEKWHKGISGMVTGEFQFHMMLAGLSSKREGELTKMERFQLVNAMIRTGEVGGLNKRGLPFYAHPKLDDFPGALNEAFVQLGKVPDIVPAIHDFCLKGGYVQLYAVIALNAFKYDKSDPGFISGEVVGFQDVTPERWIGVMKEKIQDEVNLEIVINENKCRITTVHFAEFLSVVHGWRPKGRLLKSETLMTWIITSIVTGITDAAFANLFRWLRQVEGDVKIYDVITEYSDGILMPLQRLYPHDFEETGINFHGKTEVTYRGKVDVLMSVIKEVDEDAFFKARIFSRRPLDWEISKIVKHLINRAPAHVKKVGEKFLKNEYKEVDRMVEGWNRRIYEAPSGTPKRVRRVNSFTE